MKNVITLLAILIASTAHAAPRQVPVGLLDFTHTDAVTASAKSGHTNCYVKTDGHEYCRDSAGVEARKQSSTQNDLLLKSSSGGYSLQVKAASQSADLTLTLPPDDGTVGQAIKTDGNGNLYFDDVNISGTVPIGGLVPFAGSSAPTGFLFCDGAAVSRATYAALFAVIGTAYGQGDGSTTFNVPDLRGAFPRGAMPSALNSISGSGTASSNNATFTAHGLNRTGMKVRLSSGTLSGLSTSTDYFAIVVDANTLAFASSLADALSGTKISISGSNSAVIRQWVDPDATTRDYSTVGSGNGSSLGSWQADEFKSHVHGVAVNNDGGTNGPYVMGRNIWSNSGTQNTGSTGGSETRPVNVYLNYIIKY